MRPIPDVDNQESEHLRGWQVAEKERERESEECCDYLRSGLQRRRYCVDACECGGSLSCRCRFCVAWCVVGAACDAAWAAVLYGVLPGVR